MFESGFVVRDAAWHNLATILKDPPSVEEGIKAAGLAWDVALHDILLALPDSKARPIIDTHKAVVRQTDNSVLGIVSNQYVPIQNKDVFSFFDAFIQDGTCSLEAAGSVRNGKNVWALARITSGDVEVSPEDTLFSYLLMATTHDGSGSAWAAFTGIRVVCWNTYSAAVRSAESTEGHRALRVAHKGNVRENIEAVRATINIGKRRMGDLVEAAQVMRRKDLDVASFYAFMENVYAPQRNELRKNLQDIYAVYNDESRPKEQREMALEAAQKIEEQLARPVRKTSTLQMLVELFERGPGANLAGQTVWGAVNAVTHYEEHLRPGGNEDRLYSSWFGGSTEKVRNQAMSVAQTLVS